MPKLRNVPGHKPLWVLEEKDSEAVNREKGDETGT